MAGKKQGIRKYFKFYIIAGKSTKHYVDCLKKYSFRNKVLEIGCGKWGYASFDTVKMGAESVIGIDISDAAIESARSKAIDGKFQNIDFRVMNCEELNFPDNSFDLICGTGILHHIDLNKTYPEIAKKLTSGGRAVFKEPLGHNPIINFFRKLTPKRRDRDEHPLLDEDLKLAEKFFHTVELNYFHLLSLFALPFQYFPFFDKLLRLLDSADEKLFFIFPSLKKYAWIVVMILDEPKKHFK